MVFNFFLVFKKKKKKDQALGTFAPTFVWVLSLKNDVKRKMAVIHSLQKASQYAVVPEEI